MLLYPEQIVSNFIGSESESEITGFLHVLPKQLGEVWNVTRTFCLLVQPDTRSQRFLKPSTISRTMTAVMYRLLSMNFTTGSRDELVRIGLLVFTHHIFLQGKGIRIACYHILQTYQNHLMHSGLEKSIDDIPPQVMLWLLMVGCISMFDISKEAWLGKILKDYAAQCRVKSWKDLQRILKQCMWIPILDDRLGEQVWISLSGGSSPASKASIETIKQHDREWPC